MSGARSAVRVTLAASRWILPWIGLLLVSTTVAYAINGALSGSSATPYGWPAVSTAPVPRVSAMDVRAYEEGVWDIRGSCTSLFGSYNFWLYDKNRRGPCALAAPDVADPTLGAD